MTTPPIPCHLLVQMGLNAQLVNAQQGAPAPPAVMVVSPPAAPEPLPSSGIMIKSSTPVTVENPVEVITPVRQQNTQIGK